MKQVVKRVLVGFLGVSAGLILLLLNNSAPVLANEEQGRQLIVTINDKVIPDHTEEKVSPGIDYIFLVYNMGNMECPLPVDLTSVLDEQNKVVSGKVTSDSTDTIYTFSTKDADAGKTYKIIFKTKDVEPKSVMIQLKVNNMAKAITLNSKSYTMNIKDKKTLTATVSPDDAFNKEIIWKSSNNKVATVSNGVVRAVAAGKCTITASLKDGTLPVTCQITVRKPILNHTSKSIAKSKSFTLKVSYLKDKVTWKTSNKKIATVSNGKVTGKKAGSVTITAKCGSYTMTCKVKVTDPRIINSSKEEVEGVYVTSGYKRLLKVKGGSGKVTWKSSNKKTATVDKGLVKGLKTGSCYIYATVDGKTLKCKVTIRSNVLNTTPIKNGRRIKRGVIALSNASIYYNKGRVIYKCYAVNSTSYKKVEKYNHLKISIYANGSLVASQSYKNIKLNLKQYKSKALTFTFDKKNVKKRVDLRNVKINVKYSYDYQYWN